MVSSLSKVAMAATSTATLVAAAKFAKTDFAATQAVCDFCIAASGLLVLLLLLLLMFSSVCIGYLVPYRPNVHSFGLKLESIFCQGCGIDHGVKCLVGDTARHYAAHFRV